MQIKLTPVSWMKYTSIIVLDPDGWDRKSRTDWEKPITLGEFLDKAAMSTTMGWPTHDRVELHRLALKAITEELELC
jgi:hypothetical protein